VKFHADRHFIYISAHRDEHKEELYFYYKLTEEDMEEITKEWPIDFLIRVKQKNSLTLTSSETLWSLEKIMSNTSKETTPDSPRGGGDDKVDQE
jgi:hypothetical protein